jgi:hypothetical protein
MPSPIQLVPELRKVASFRPGNWNGRNFDKSFVQSLHDNFQKYSAGQNPWYKPFVNINHNDEFRFGRIAKTELAKDGTLYLWAENLPQQVADWLTSHMLDERSIEFIEPKIDKTGQLLGFTGPDGKIVRTPVLKCLSLLGNDVPAVKGLPPIPPVTYQMRDTGGVVLKFSSKAGGNRMNEELLNQLRALGFDVSKLPPETTDDQLNTLIAAIQAIFGGGTNANGTTNGNGAATAPQTNMAQAGTAGVATLNPGHAATQPQNPVVPQLPALTGQPEQLILKFRDNMLAEVRNMLGPINQGLNQIRANQNAITSQAMQQAEAVKNGRITEFLDRMGKSGQVSPAMRPGVEKFLRKCDAAKVSKFSAKLADGRETGTELDEQMNHIETTYPVLRTHNNPHIAQPNPGQAGNNGVRSEIVQRALNSTPEGRAYLQRQKAAGK